MVRQLTDTCHCEQTLNPKADIGWLLVTASDYLCARADERLKPLGLTAAQYGVIANLTRGFETPAQLCQQMRYDRGAMTRLLDRMEAKGLVVRKPHQNDLRSVRVCLTGKGRAIQPEIAPVIDQLYQQALAGLSDSEARQLSILLSRVIARLK
ncbi:MarR family winged helix-turn-helix transcriptional regulator [Marinimicrobium sp. ARAG 43.8]|uniref:MarR family winged helix-turn-helix transcriptional regulator n=1 Tax=Marinimicrobium sp. ARAG 43.8 TaxID=3418719 RepID=UPI003CE8A481